MCACLGLSGSALFVAAAGFCALGVEGGDFLRGCAEESDLEFWGG